MNISRRQFLQTAALASASIGLPGSLLAKEKKMLREKTDRVLVLLTLTGGNDSLNTVIPYKNPFYYKARPDLSIPAKKVLRLNDRLGLHPALRGLKNIYDEGLLAVYNRTGLPHPEYTHAGASRFWETASENRNVGWVGGILDDDPRETAIEMDDFKNLTLRGVARSGFLFKNIAEDLSFQHRRSSESRYPDTSFSQKLKNTANLVINHYPARYYHLSLPGFDTHVRQESSHGFLLRELGEGLNAFVEDLRKNKALQKTMILVYSEFGRDMAQNSFGGTDHGPGGSVFLISGSLKMPGLFNEPVALSDLHSQTGIYNIPAGQIDGRRIHATLLNRWLKIAEKPLLQGSFPLLSFI